ncbi:MAG: hypothetical protein KAJ10_03675 [Thermodesulfovibrionia bacterium]|nr:hypothetical protein [Thermodesulfovibrionia bacterium]
MTIIIVEPSFGKFMQQPVGSRAVWPCGLVSDESMEYSRKIQSQLQAAAVRPTRMRNRRTIKTVTILTMELKNPLEQELLLICEILK